MKKTRFTAKQALDHPFFEKAWKDNERVYYELLQ